MNARTAGLVSPLLPILIAFVPGCATIEDLKTVRQEMSTSIEELKKELEAAKQANQQQTQQVAEESKKGLDLLREAVKTNYETGIGETQKQVRVLSEDVQQLKERQQRLLQGLSTMQDSVGKLSGALQQARQELDSEPPATRGALGRVSKSPLIRSADLWGRARLFAGRGSPAQIQLEARANHLAGNRRDRASPHALS